MVKLREAKLLETFHLGALYLVLDLHWLPVEAFGQLW
jgi:hypothetical protein